MDEPPTAAKIAGLDQPPRDDRPSSIMLNPDDPEAGHRLHHSASRATMPLDTGGFRSRQQSAVTFPEPSEAGDEDEYAWGPSHPCFPHLNPHVPVSSPLYSTTRIIRIKRDWMIAGDLAPTFANLYPEVLDPLISEDQFRNIIKKINAELQAAFNPYSTRAWVDAVMGAATLWLWEDLGLTGVKKTLKALEDWIEEWNRTEGVKEGVKLIPLRRTGYLTLDIQIPDPHIGLEQSTASIRSGLVSPTADADGPPQLPHPTGIKV
ncbi:Golgin subfamily A member 7/ERF4 family-domain-containing protein [Macrophomina phaseolina]|uniref:Ras modification protein ERF4 n=1 Tax=Macrophomina phaseolina TaxID=35725 RepID=A0ABQ8GBE3_9PEZI|nr:Golgin subfamily A member 7/ERF4 family-domain-containing protein [Macrophomina phaseolina]